MISVAELRSPSPRSPASDRTHWRKGATEPGAGRELTAGALRRLAALGLIRRDGDWVIPLPALARYGYAEPTFTGRPKKMTDQARAGQGTAFPDPLPVPRRSRWQPLRTGLADLFYCGYQEFWFCDGRLMLGDNNGTGKSKVLALVLPFLPTRISLARLEPDGDRGKKMKWNLLLGGCRYDERLGYTWLEFGRRTEEGEDAYFTIGCGLKVVGGAASRTAGTSPRPSASVRTCT